MSTLRVDEIKDSTGASTGLTIDASGRVQKPQLVHFHGNRVGLTKAELGANIDYNVVRDTNSGWNSTNKQYTIPINGVYQMSFTNIGQSSVDTSDQNHKMQYVRGGSTVDIVWAYHTNDAQHEQVGVSVTYYLQTNDLIQMSNVSGVVYNNYYNTFSICLIG